MKNKQVFLNIGLKDYNIVGGSVKQVRKKNGIAMTSRKFRKWATQIKNPIVKRKKNTKMPFKTKTKPDPDTKDWVWDWDKLNGQKK